MMLILDERKHVQNTLESAARFKNDTECKYELERYAIILHDDNSLSLADKKELLIEYAKKHYKKFDIDDWTDKIDRILKETKNKKPFYCAGIPITQKELDEIGKLEDMKHQQLAFSMVVIAKYMNARNHPYNNNWCNMGANYKDLFLRANIGGTNEDGRCAYLNELHKAGIITFPETSGKVNDRVEIIDADGEPVTTITDLCNLGLQYKALIGRGTLHHCPVCGAIKKNDSPCDGCMTIWRGGKIMKTKKLICGDCGMQYVVPANVNRSTRCPDCQEKYRTKIWHDTYRAKKCTQLD